MGAHQTLLMRCAEGRNVLFSSPPLCSWVGVLGHVQPNLCCMPNRVPPPKGLQTALQGRVEQLCGRGVVRSFTGPHWPLAPASSPMTSPGSMPQPPEPRKPVISCTGIRGLHCGPRGLDDGRLLHVWLPHCMRSQSGEGC